MVLSRVCHGRGLGWHVRLDRGQSRRLLLGLRVRLRRLHTWRQEAPAVLENLLVALLGNFEARVVGQHVRQSIVIVLVKRINLLLLRWRLDWLIHLFVFSAGLVSLLPLLLFDVFLNALFNILLQLSALADWKLVKFEFKDFTLRSVVLKRVAHDVQNARLLGQSERGNLVLQERFLFAAHRLILP